MLTQCLLLFLDCGLQSVENNRFWGKCGALPILSPQKNTLTVGADQKTLRNDGTGEQGSRISKVNVLSVAWKALEIPLEKQEMDQNALALPDPIPEAGPASWCLAAVLVMGLCWWSGLGLSKAVIPWKSVCSHPCQCPATP